jgi:cytochrome c oxidase subunit 2
MTVGPDRADGAGRADRIVRRWAFLSVGIVAALVIVAAAAGLREAAMPQVAVETVDPRTLHITGEFVEANLGSAVETDGTVTVRVIGQQYSFTPQCILVPAATPITFRATSADVIHGFLIGETNLNEMLVPGYISVFRARFNALGDHLMPCHEFCGVGHEGMWAKVRVIEKKQFFDLARKSRRLDCAE